MDIFPKGFGWGAVKPGMSRNKNYDKALALAKLDCPTWQENDQLEELLDGAQLTDHQLRHVQQVRKDTAKLALDNYEF